MTPLTPAPRGPDQSSGPTGSSAQARLAGLIGRFPSGTLPVGIGLGVLGLMSYAFLAIAARSLSVAGFAQLSVVWTALFTLGPGVFLPLEQEIGRRLAITQDRRTWAVVVRRSLGLGAALVLILTVLTVVVSLLTHGRLLDNQTALLVAMICANAALALVHPSRGFLAGTGRFGRYGAQLATDGTLRAVGALLLVLAAVHSPSWYGWVLVFAQLVAVAVTLRGTHPPLRSADQGEHTEPHLIDLARGIGWMLAGVLAAQVLANAGPIVVKVLAAPGDAAAGSFLTALVLARIPLFLFAALQASLLPGLARLFDSGQRHAVAVMMRWLLISLAVIGAVITLVLAALGPTITALLFGAGYRSARGPLVLLSAACTVYMLAAAVAQVLLALHASRAVALGWWLGVIAFAAALPLHSSLPIRVGVALLIGSAASGASFVTLLRRELRR